MKKRAKLFLALLFVLILSLGFFPKETKAATDEVYNYNVTALKAKTLVTAKRCSSAWNRTDRKYYYNYNLYKITLPSDGYIKLETSDATVGLKLLKSFKKDVRLSKNEPITYFSSKKNTYYYVLSKGTYYICNPYSDKDTNIKYTFSKAVNPTNYSRNLAATLAQKKSQTLVYTWGNEYDRWYKVCLTKNQAVTITTKTLDEDYSRIFFEFRNSNGKLVSYDTTSNTTGGTRTYKTAKLKKGTYYIHCYPGSGLFNNRYATGRIGTISWK
ncbi:hypothetical protein [Butyrivibrio sp. YAB3001]|uniref:hypothetical protein n=1 Tax=Butyrivibrio sp. YAB3001 TaxID=1520812 RepID=UPI0008F681A1|nr:hypothetical protein [Butyrivibrio sp. YAB3001]SFB70342.1 hypothetical protein SAMN02910398_00335 [Butyrivibrio sp. YAB3001]